MSREFSRPFSPKALESDVFHTSHTQIFMFFQFRRPSHVRNVINSPLAHYKTFMLYSHMGSLRHFFQTFHSWRGNVGWQAKFQKMSGATDICVLTHTQPLAFSACLKAANVEKAHGSVPLGSGLGASMKIPGPWTRWSFIAISRYLFFSSSHCDL